MIYLRHTGITDNLNIRLAEWGLGLMLLLWGAILVSPDDTFSRPAFTMMARIASENVWGVVLTLLGTTRIVVLLINGAWRRSPHLRAATAFLSCFVWTQIALSIWESGIFATALAVYPVLLLMDIYVVIRAAGEARLSDDEASRHDLSDT